jgi:acetyl-CoA carboxylase biotin carboxyl carrier protein
LDIKRIEELIEVIKESRVTEVTVKQDGLGVTLRKSTVSPCQTASASPRQKAAKQKDGTTPQPAPEASAPAPKIIPAPMVGIFHSLDDMAAPGMTVKKGQPVGVIESMKLMNEIVCPEDGTLAEVYVEDGMPVEYGHALFRLETD